MEFHSFLIKYGEIGIKGKNRYIFEDALVRQIRYALQSVDGEFLVHKCHGRVYVDCEGEYDYEETVESLKKVFGIVGICPVVRVEDKGFEELKKDYVSGVTVSGGDPFHLENREEIGALAKEIREKFPDKTIWLYTGYEWEEICHLSFLSNIDVIVDGKFKIEEKDNNLHWKGSANQRVIDVKASLRAGEVRLYQE